jgi:uncharacterized protein (TIGR00159 family)
MLTLPWQAIVDLIVLTAAIYALLHWSRDARALRVIFGILLVEAAGVAATGFGLVLTAWVLHGVAIASAVLLIMLFQPELRHALNRLEVLTGRRRTGTVAATGFEALAAALYSLAHARRGALVVLRRRDPVNELVKGGVPLGGQLSEEILEAIFRKVSPVHDGAVVIDGHRITRVAAVLPLSPRDDLPRDWGTRHRAAMGLSEQCDAVVLVVSEERGCVSLVHQAGFEIVETEQQLIRRLQELVAGNAAAATRPVIGRREFGLLFLSVAIASVVWAAFLFSGSTVQVFAIPVQFVEVRRDLQLASDAVPVVTVRLRGSNWRLATLPAESLVMRVPLRGFQEGEHTVALGPYGLRMPTGITVDSIVPDEITIQLLTK